MWADSRSTMNTFPEPGTTHAQVRQEHARWPYPALLPQLAQALDNLILFAWLHWTKAALVVDEHDLAPLHHDHHIGQVVAVQINEAQRDGRLVAARPKELWSHVDTSMGSIATRPFDHSIRPRRLIARKWLGALAESL